MKFRTLALMVDAVDAALVERPGPGQAPTAFRIWASGANDVDGGTTYFTANSAKALMAEQEARGRLYPFDFDHLSLLPDRPAESGRAAGWHRLAVREGEGGPELWAVEIDWCTDAKAGLEAQPPHWRYFSPAFRTKDDEVTSYINCALCINPLTHQLPSLASESAAQQGPNMKEKMLAALATLGDSAASDDEKKAAMKALADYFGEAKDDEKKDDSKEEPKKDAEPAKDDSKEEPKKDAEGCDEKTETKAFGKIERRLNEYDKLLARVAKQDAEERTRLLAARTDLTDGMRKELSTKPLEEVTRMLSFIPAPTAPANARATQGEHDVDGKGAAGGLQGAELEEYNRLAGKRAPVTKAFERRADGGLQLNAITPTEWNRLRQKDGK